jgi:hypothetical protein
LPRPRWRRCSPSQKAITEIADDGSNDWIERETKSGRMLTVPDQEHINRSRLRIDARKWLLSKLAPRKYGDKLELTGLPAAPPVQTADPVTLEDAERQYLELIRAGMN